MKKILTAAVCAGMIFTASAYADVTKDGNSVTVSYTKLAEKPFDVLVYVFKPQAKLADGKIDAEDMQQLFRAETRKSAVDFSDTFNMMDSDDEGIYHVVIGGFQDNTKRFESFVHLKSDSETRIVSELNAAESTSALKDVFEAYDGFAWETDKENAAYKNNLGEFYNVLFENFKGSFKKTEDAVSAFDKTCTILEINTLKGDSLISAIEKLGLTDSEFYKSHTKETAAVYEKYTDKGKNIEVLKKSLAEAIAVTDLNLSNMENVLAALKRYPNVFSVSFDGDFKKVSESQMARALYHKNFVRAKEADDAFNARLKELSGNKISNTGGGGGGNSSGGTKTGFTPAASSGVNSDFIENLSDNKIFADTDSCEWAKDYIESMYRRQIMIGDNGYFRPNDFLKREELVKITALAKEWTLENNAVKNFDDISENDWFYPYVQTAVSNGAVSGISDTLFGTGQNVSRQEAAAILYRTFGNNEAPQSEIGFYDSNEISDYAVNAIGWLSEKNVISGFPDNTFRPNEGLTRAQAAKIIYELLK